MKQLIILIAFLLPVAIQAQDTIKIPTPVAKQIVLDLVSGDSAKAILDITKQQLSLTERKVTLKDSIISNYVQKCDIYDQRITNEQAKFNVQGQYVSQLEKNVRKLKATLLFRSGIFTALIGGLTYMYISK